MPSKQNKTQSEVAKIFIISPMKYGILTTHDRFSSKDAEGPERDSLLQA